jgi:hypothetical protein
VKHIACSTCFSASISAVSVSRNPAQCPHCAENILTFSPLDGSHAAPFILPSPPRIQASARMPSKCDEPTYPVLRIDNVAWVSSIIEVQFSLQSGHHAANRQGLSAFRGLTARSSSSHTHPTGSYRWQDKRLHGKTFIRILVQLICSISRWRMKKQLGRFSSTDKTH